MISVKNLRKHSDLPFKKIAVLNKNWKEIDLINRDDDKFDNYDAESFFPQQTLVDGNLQEVLVVIIEKKEKVKVNWEEVALNLLSLAETIEYVGDYENGLRGRLKEECNLTEEQLDVVFGGE